jgi:hypothetical protein
MNRRRKWPSTRGLHASSKLLGFHSKLRQRRHCAGCLNKVLDWLKKGGSTSVPTLSLALMLEILFQFLSTLDVLGSINPIESMPRLDRCLTMLLVYCHQINVRGRPAGAVAHVTFLPPRLGLYSCAIFDSKSHSACCRRRSPWE